jgi:hypothetical protein
MRVPAGPSMLRHVLSQQQTGTYSQPVTRSIHDAQPLSQATPARNNVPPLVPSPTHLTPHAWLAPTQVLVLARNSITEVPGGVGHLTALRVLDASSNALNALPASLGASLLCGAPCWVPMAVLTTHERTVLQLVNVSVVTSVVSTGTSTCRSCPYPCMLRRGDAHLLVP